MRTRFEALLSVTLALVGATVAEAGLGGLACGCPQACGDPQADFAACASQGRPAYKMVYDSVLEKRFHVSYQTVSETVLKPVTRTVLIDRVQRLISTPR